MLYHVHKEHMRSAALPPAIIPAGVAHIYSLPKPGAATESETINGEWSSQRSYHLHLHINQRSNEEQRKLANSTWSIFDIYEFRTSVVSASYKNFESRIIEKKNGMSNNNFVHRCGANAKKKLANISLVPIVENFIILLCNDLNAVSPHLSSQKKTRIKDENGSFTY